MKYREPQFISKEEFDLVFRTGETAQICDALVDAVHSIPDSEWLEKQCLVLLCCDNIEIQGIAITSIGHLARLFRNISLSNISDALFRVFQERPILSGRINDVLDDIYVFMNVDLREKEPARWSRIVDMQK